jgi:arabinogalactan oligomer/maltooligosaccharide transport system substrate-binding protein
MEALASRENGLPAFCAVDAGSPSQKQKGTPMTVTKRMALSAAAVALAAITATTLAGCSGSASANKSANDAASGSKTLTVWVDASRVSALKDIAAEFTKKSGVKVNLVQKDFGKLEQDLETQIPTGKGPDIAVGANDWTGQLATDGVIQPVELGDSASKYEKVALDAFNFKGQVYALPYSIENIALVRNTKLAPTAPKT